MTEHLIWADDLLAPLDLDSCPLFYIRIINIYIVKYRNFKLKQEGEPWAIILAPIRILKAS